MRASSNEIKINVDTMATPRPEESIQRHNVILPKVKRPRYAYQTFSASEKSLLFLPTFDEPESESSGNGFLLTMKRRTAAIDTERGTVEKDSIDLTKQDTTIPKDEEDSKLSLVACTIIA